ncbi:unnamed protein product [Cyclocybe aegerita]|uniref:Essential protein Yae1 N-terminal domain-containing protein n=1 Tax=Cyclocybe aegerita TaxID=1973307 RepID=A0A8S0VWA9_CYCAE|nr:unnamed protein product [Cyclocybe aegerita]
MPTEDKPLPSIQVDDGMQTTTFLSPHDIVAQVREATYSPSPLLRILQDPSLQPSEPGEKERKEKRRRPSRSPRREHRAEMVAAIAIAEEERETKRLKALLRVSGDRLEHEIRRADDALARLEASERNERELEARIRRLEAENDELHRHTVRAERDARDYQTQLEVAQREVLRLQDDLVGARREMDELQYSESKALASAKKYQMTVHSLELYGKQRENEIQAAVDRWYNTGRDDGYEEGHAEGYDEGRKAGLKEGLKKGRKQGLKEGFEEGQREEWRNAAERFDKYLATAGNVGSERTRRWAQSIYRGPGCSETTLGPSDSESVRCRLDSPVAVAVRTQLMMMRSGDDDGPIWM